MTSQATFTNIDSRAYRTREDVRPVAYDGDPPKLFTGSRVDAREVLGKSGYRQQVAMAAFTDIIVVKKRLRRHFGRKGQQTGKGGQARPKASRTEQFTLVDPSSQLEYRI